MTRSSHIAKLNFDPEIERTFHILRRTTKHITTKEASPNRYTESPLGFNAVAELSQKNIPRFESVRKTISKDFKSKN